MAGVPTLEELVKKVGVPPETLDTQCTDDHLGSISLFLDWRSVVPHLGLSETEQGEIESDGKKESEKRVKTLWKWRAKFAFKASYRRLIEILLTIGMADDAQKVCTLLKGSPISEIDGAAGASQSMISTIEPKSPFSHQITDREVPPSTILEAPPGAAGQPRSVEDEIDGLEEEFDGLANQAADDIEQSVEEGKTKFSRVKSTITRLPVSLRHHHIRFLAGKLSAINNARTINELFSILDLYWDFINCGLLERLIGRFGSKKIQQGLEGYLKKLNDFCERTTVREFTGNWKCKIPSNIMAGFSMEMGEDWQDKTLKEVKEFKTQFSRLFSFTKHALPLTESSHHSVILSFALQRSFPMSTEVLRPAQQFLQEQGVLRVFFKGVCLLDLQAFQSVSSMEDATVGGDTPAYQELQSSMEPEHICGQEDKEMVDHEQQQTASLAAEQVSSEKEEGVNDQHHQEQELQQQQPKHVTTPSGRVLIKRQLRLHEDQPLPSAIPLLIRDNYQYDEENHKLVERPEMAEISSKFKLVPAALKLLASIKKPVAVLAVCGPTHTGKSYFLSRILDESDAFQLGHTMHGCTHGIWMGTSILECDEFVLLLLDTEGINKYSMSASGATDATILMMVILLSSYLIYNSMRIPTRNDLEEMSFFAHLSSSIITRGDRERDFGNFRPYFPNFLWLLRDVTLTPTDSTGKHLSPTEFLKTQVLVRSKQVMHTPADIVAMAVMNYFPTVECLTLPPPSAEIEVITNITENEAKLSPDFTRSMKEAVEYVLQSVSTKKGFNTSATVNGDTLAQLASKYLEAINTGATPTLENTWVTVVEQKLSETADRLVAEYKKEMEAALQDKLPMEEHTLLENHQNLLEEKRASLCNNIQLLMPPDISGDSPSVTPKKEKLIAHFERQIAEYGEAEVDGTNSHGVTGGILWNFLRENSAKSRCACEALFNELFDPIEQKITTAFSDEAAPSTYTFPELCSDIEQMQKSYDTRAIGPLKHEIYTQKEREVLQHSKEMLKQMIGLSEQVLTAQNKVYEAENKATKLSESIQQLENKVKETKLEHGQILRQLDKKTLDQEMEKQKAQLMEVRMEKSVATSKAKIEEIQTISRQQIEQVKHAHWMDRGRHAAEVKQLKEASEVTQQKHVQKEAELRQQIQLIQEENRRLQRRFEEANIKLGKLGKEAEHIELEAASAKATERAEMANKKAIIAMERAEMADKRAEMANKKAIIATDRAEMADKRAEMADKEAIIATDRAEMADKRAEMADKETIIAMERAEMADKRAEMARKKATTAMERAEMADKKAGEERRCRHAMECTLADKQTWHLPPNPYFNLANMLRKVLDKDDCPGWQCIVGCASFNRMNDVPDSHPIPIPSEKIDILLFKPSTPSRKISKEMMRSVKAIAQRRILDPKRSTHDKNDSKIITETFTRMHGEGWQCVTSASHFDYSMTRDNYYFWAGSWSAGYLYVLLYCR